VYMEPQPVVELNNLEAMLADQVAEEELRILAALSMQVGRSDQNLKARPQLLVIRTE